MKHLSIWSYSNHFENKVFPSIKSIKNLNITSILTNKKIELKKISIFNNKNFFFKNDKSNFIYISSVNSQHYKNCQLALINKKNVICEKPICLKKNQLLNLRKIASKNKRKFYEIIQYVNHPIFEKLKLLLNKKKIGKILNVESEFKIPLSYNDNFRFKKNLGGGALNDVGYYPISVMFTLFNSKNVKILKKNIIKERGLDIRGKILAKNENQILFNLAWGFKSKYKNYIKINGTKGMIEVDFIYSKKILQGGKINIYRNKREVITIPKYNQIKLAFQKIFSSKKNFFEERLNVSLKILDIFEKIRKLP